MLLYRTLFVIDVVVMLVLAYFFVDGLQYSSSGAGQIIWLPILAVPAAIMFAAGVLHGQGRKRLATWLLVALAIPPALFVAFFGLLLFLNPNWQ
jgi:hypothetical protein